MGINGGQTRGGIRAWWLWLSVAAIINVTLGDTPKTKRQIYREQVLPFRGGKVPEDAFRADRLALNRLNKEGIAVPDGVLLEHRSVHNHPHSVRHDPEDEVGVLRVIQQSESRYAPEEGRYKNEMPLTVASTYLIRQPIGEEQTNIRTPDQQRPLHQYLNHMHHSNAPPRVNYEPHTLPKHRYSATPHDRYPSSSTSSSYSHYQQHEGSQQQSAPPPQPLAFRPIPTSFELPNREIQDERYFAKSHFIEDSSSKVDWSFPASGAHLERFNFEFNSLLPPNDFEFSPAAFRFYESPETFLPHNYFPYFDGERFLRKTAEGYIKGHQSSPTHKAKTVQSSKSTRTRYHKRTGQSQQ